MPLLKPKAVYAASEQHYTAAGGEVQVPRDGIYKRRKMEKGDWYTDWQSKRSSVWAWSHNGSFKTMQNCQFLNRSLFRLGEDRS